MNTKSSFYTTADKNWKDQIVRNPETGNKVKVSSLPPKLQLRYKPKEKEEPIGMKLDFGGGRPAIISDEYILPFLQAGLKKKDIQNILPSLMKTKEWSDTSSLISEAFKKVQRSLPSYMKNEEEFMQSKYSSKEQKLKFLAIKESAHKILEKANVIRQKLIKNAIKIATSSITTACLKMETSMSLDIPFHYSSLEDAMWKIKAQEAEKIFKVKVPIDSNFTGERKIISFKLPNEKELSLNEMLAGKKDPLYWQFGAALYRSPDETLSHFRCQIHDNAVELPGKLCVAAKKDSWFVYPVPNNKPSSEECWSSVENYLQSLVEEHIQKQESNIISGGVITAGTNLIKKSKSANRKEDGDIFGYDSVINEIWKDRILKAKDYFLTEFDLKNNDSAKERRLITFTIPDDDTSPTEFQFACSLWKAGGDWENPVAYFRCQLVNGSMLVNNKDFYPKEPNPYKDPWFVVVPPADFGNIYLIQHKGTNKNSDKIIWSPLTDSDSIPKSIEDTLEHDHKAMWKWLEDYLMKIVEKYLFLKELEKDIYDKSNGKIGYEDANDKAVEKMISTVIAEYIIPRPYCVKSEFDNASLFIEVPDELTTWIQKTAKSIPEKLLTTEGIEDETHITLLHGVPDEENIIERIQKLIDHSIRVSNDDKVTYFDNNDASVAKVDIKSTDLRWTHAVLKSILPNKHKYFFSPHITIAYLKWKERLSHVENIEVPKFHWCINKIMLGHRDGSVEVINIGAINKEKVEGSSLKYINNVDKYSDEAYKLAKQENIGIMRNRELYTVVLDSYYDNNVIGALWIVEGSQEFSFDVVIKKEYQKQGIGKKLIEDAIHLYKQGGYEEAGAKFIVDSVNKNLVPYLKSKGFDIIETEGGHTILEYKVHGEVIIAAYDEIWEIFKKVMKQSKIPNAHLSSSDVRGYHIPNQDGYSLEKVRLGKEIAIIVQFHSVNWQHPDKTKLKQWTKQTAKLLQNAKLKINIDKNGIGLYTNYYSFDKKGKAKWSKE